MVYETITVRMSRSSDTIPWGFTVSGGSGSIPIRISSVQKESLADKAGLQADDEITELCGHNTKNMPVQEAKNIVQGGASEIHMLLQRNVTEHPCLPWQLTEKDNQITVDQIKPQTAVSYDSYRRERTDKYTKHTTSNYEVPITNEASRYRTSSFNKQEGSAINRPRNLTYQPAPFTNVTNTGSPYVSKVHQSEGFQNSYTADSYTRSPKAESRNTTSGYNSSGGDKPGSGVASKAPIALPSSAPSAVPPSAPALNTAGRTYVPVHVDTTDAGYHSAGSGGGYRRGSGATANSPRQGGGARVTFQHSPRTERQLSPHATVRHLQYNSPMNLYSPHSAAEQYLQQTGGLFGTDPLLQHPKGDEAYLTSETRRLIAEEEGQSMHEKSPAMQSASFKRISRACGTPVD